MPFFEIEQYETHVATILVEADTPAQALMKLFSGAVGKEIGSTVFLELNHDLGMPAEENLDITEKLRELGEEIANDDIIETIRSITEVDAPPPE